MADGRQQCEWDRALSLMAFVGGMFSKDPPRPSDLIPDRYRPKAARPRAKTEAESDAESKVAW
jgi:hypothetical protein